MAAGKQCAEWQQTTVSSKEPGSPRTDFRPRGRYLASETRESRGNRVEGPAVVFRIRRLTPSPRPTAWWLRSGPSPTHGARTTAHENTLHIISPFWRTIVSCKTLATSRSLFTRSLPYVPTSLVPTSLVLRSSPYLPGSFAAPSPHAPKTPNLPLYCCTAINPLVFNGFRRQPQPLYSRCTAVHCPQPTQSNSLTRKTENMYNGWTAVHPPAQQFTTVRKIKR